MTRDEFDALDMCSRIDLVEAVVVEPAVNAGSSVDEVLDQMHKRIMEANAEALVAAGRGEEVFDTPAWRAAAERLETMFPPSVSESELLGEEDTDADEGIDDLDENMPDFEDDMPHEDSEPVA